MTPRSADESAIAHYRLSTKLGEGGMGAVYRATDTKLNRDVAIKILPDAFASDPDRLARFTREAQVLASLNHPNIAQIYGIEDRAIVMELVEGSELPVPLPLADALAFARQIADALEAAHEKGIIHRHLKPANIKVTAAGIVKVLDFGLAAITPPATAAPSANASFSPTLTIAGTQAGMIMGTASYMSPEQAAGKPVDKRADVWSFGVVLWEMLCGRKLFEGETISHTLADVLRAPIDLTELPGSTPAPIRKLIARCLDRNAKTRLRDLGEARILIDEVLGGKAIEEAHAQPVTSRSSRLPWMVAAVLAVALVPASIGWFRKTSQTPRPLLRFDSEELPGRSSFAGRMVVISPDGSRVVYPKADANGVTRLWTRKLDQSAASPIPGTEEALQSCIFPNERDIAFYGRGKIRKMSFDGGAAVDLFETNAVIGMSCGEPGIAFAAGIRSGISLIPPDGGPPRLISPLNKAANEATQRYPQFLPGGESLIFTSNTRGGEYENADIVALVLKTGERKLLHRHGYYGRYLGSRDGPGYLIFASGPMLYALEMNPQTLTVREPAVPVLSDVAMFPTSGSVSFEAAQNGSALMIKGQNSEVTTLRILEQGEHFEPLHVTSGSYANVRVLPDTKHILVMSGSGDQRSAALVDTERDVVTRLTFTAGGFISSLCSEGKHFFYSIGTRLWYGRVDGGGVPQQLLDNAFTTTLSPDGKNLAFGRRKPGAVNDTDIFVAPFHENSDGTATVGEPKPFLASPAAEYEAAFSPDGRWVAYMSDESGSLQIFVRPFPGPGGKWQVSSGINASRPVWNPRGRELYYLNSDGRIVAVPYTATADSFNPGKARVWSDVRVSSILNARNFDVMPDGQHILALVNQDNEGGHAARLTVLVNFLDEVERKIEAAKSSRQLN